MDSTGRRAFTSAAVLPARRSALHGEPRAPPPPGRQVRSDTARALCAACSISTERHANRRMSGGRASVRRARRGPLESRGGHRRLCLLQAGGLPRAPRLPVAVPFGALAPAPLRVIAPRRDSRGVWPRSQAPERLGLPWISNREGASDHARAGADHPAAGGTTGVGAVQNDSVSDRILHRVDSGARIRVVLG